MKKFLVVLLCVVMALSAVMAAAAQDNKGASGSTDKDVYIDFWGVWGNDNYRAMYWQEKAAEFCEKYEAETGTSFQFLRTGYFCKDPDSTDALPVYNRTVGLRDTFAKQTK